MCLSIVLLLICSFISLNHGAMESDQSMGMQQHTHIEKEALLKTFEIDDHIIDCINIYKQLAFQHPLLINHTLQLKPNYPGETNDYISKASTPRNTSKSCPEGFVPIERIQRNGHFRGNLFRNHTTKHPPRFLPRRGLQQGSRVQRFSTIETFNAKYYGAKATLNVWHPKVEQENSYSSSQFWLLGGDSHNAVEAGWIAYPTMYGDNEVRLFAYWTADGYTNTGCYNLECPGFIQINEKYPVDAYLHPVSVYDGQQTFISVEIFRDMATGNWWLRVQNNDVGYWPKELFSVLDQGADVVSIGGSVSYYLPGPQTGPEMGSGHFAGEDYQKAAFIRNIQVLDTSNEYKDPPNFIDLTSDDRCYDISVTSNTGGTWGRYMFYGGAGISETCK